MALTLLVGPSGVGKTAIWQKILKYPFVKPFKTNTSRPIRPEEMLEDFEPQYHFHSKQEFEEKIKKGAFFEYEEYVGNYYGTLRSDIENAISDDKHLWVGIVDIRGAKNIMKAYPNVFAIFILPPSEDELLRRLMARNSENEEIALKRLQVAKKELSQQDDLSNKIVNSDLDETVKKIYEMIIFTFKKEGEVEEN